MTKIFAYKTMPTDLAINGAALNKWMDLPEINRVLNDQYRFYGNYSLTGQNKDYLKRGNFIKAQVEDGSWQYFEIFTVKKTMNAIAVTARHIGFMANRNFIEYCYTANGDGSQIMKNLQESLAFKQKFVYKSTVTHKHQFTAKQVAPVESIIGSNSGNQNLAGVASSELEMDNYQLTLVDRIGEDNGYRIDFGVNLESVNEEVDEESITNSLYLVGGVPDNDYDENKDPITFKYLEIAGVNDSNRRIKKRENEDCKTIADLKKWGQSLFDNDRIHEPKATHSVSMVSLEYTMEYKELYKKLTKLHFGDTAHVHVKKLDMDIQERMVEYTWFPTIGKFKNIVLGNDLKKYTTQTKTQEQKTRNKIDNRVETMVTNVKNATSWITGNSGGHVVLYPEKAPEMILIMDTDDVKTAKKVWRWSLNGLEYSKNGINGDYDLAMTADGKIVADFIKVGTLSAIDVRGVNIYGSKIEGTNIYGSVFETVNEEGIRMHLEDGSIRYMEESKKKSLGSVNFANGSIILQNNNPLSTIWLGNENIGLNHKEQIHLVAPNIKLSGRVDVSSSGLFIGGREVYPGQGGGGSGSEGGQGNNWSGEYPPEVTSQRDKYAWVLWVILLAKGYSKQAIAGILGNIEGEVGSSMNPDTAQSGGAAPGYGIVQWDGSAYPLVGSPTSNGRVYVQRLMNKAGIKEDYKTMEAQAKLVDWSMYHGQWGGAVSPTTVAGFKAIKDASNAAYVFEKNFERPEDAHPERQGWAVAWYNKFKDLKIPQANKDIISIAKSWLGWFKYGQVHPSSDLGNLSNPNKNGTTDCSGFIWLVLNKAGYKVPGNMQWYTGSMTSDARGSHRWLKEISGGSSRAGDIVIYNQGSGAGNNGHTAFLLEKYHGNNTQIIEMGGDSRKSGVNISTIGYAFGYLLSGDRCIARAIK